MTRGEGNPLGTVQKFEICLYWRKVDVQTRIWLENDMHKILSDFEIKKGHPIQIGKPDLILINKKKYNW